MSHRFHRFTQIFDLYGREFRRFFCLDIWGIFLPIMARMNLCKSVVSVGLSKRLTFSPFLIRFSLLYFFLRDALAVDGTPGEDDVG